jgi:hypothetical protein
VPYDRANVVKYWQFMFQYCLSFLARMWFILLFSSSLNSLTNCGMSYLTITIGICCFENHGRHDFAHTGDTSWWRKENYEIHRGFCNINICYFYRLFSYVVSAMHHSENASFNYLFLWTTEVAVRYFSIILYIFIL